MMMPLVEMGKSNMTMMLALMLLANGVMAAKMQANKHGVVRRESLTSSLAINLDEDMKEATWKWNGAHVPKPGNGCPAPTYVFNQETCCCGGNCCWNACRWDTPPVDCLTGQASISSWKWSTTYNHYEATITTDTTEASNEVHYNSWDADIQGKTLNDATLQIYEASLGSVKVKTADCAQQSGQQVQECNIYWCGTYPNVGKASFQRAGPDTLDVGQVTDVGMHPSPDNTKLIVIEFKVPATGDYTIDYIGAKRIGSCGSQVDYFVHDTNGDQIASVLDVNKAEGWRMDQNIHSLGSRNVGDSFYFAMANSNDYGCDSAQIRFRITRSQASSTGQASTYGAFFGNNACYGHGAIDIVHDDTAATGLTVLQCQALCTADSSCECVTYSWSSGRNCWKRRLCSPSLFEINPDFAVYVRPEAELELEVPEADYYCVHTQQCKRLLLVEDPATGEYIAPHDDAWMCKCVKDYILEGIDTDCELWKNCMDNHKDVFENQLERKIRERSGLLLLELSSGHHQPADLEGCVKDPYTEPDCGCFDDLKEDCTRDLTAELSRAPLDDELFDCMSEHLCTLEAVCSSWKCQILDNGNLRCPSVSCSLLLAVHESGEAEKAEGMEATTRPKNVMNGTGAGRLDPIASRNHAKVSLGLTTPVASGKSMLETWAEKVGVSLIADKMHGRRQSLGNMSSAEPMALLDKSVSGKSCSKTAR